MKPMNMMFNNKVKYINSQDFDSLIKLRKYLLIIVEMKTFLLIKLLNSCLMHIIEV